MTRPHTYHEVSEKQVQAERRGWRNFLICVWSLILLAVFSIAYTVASVGSWVLQ